MEERDFINMGMLAVRVAKFPAKIAEHDPER